MRKQESSLKHPFAAIEHRVIDSAAYASLGFSARSLLTLLTRQLTRDNNGHLQAAYAWCKNYGFGSEHTLQAAIAELIAKGFIYRTRSHGANRAWAKYAVTWLSIKNRDGLFLDGFVPCAWRNWQPTEKKPGGKKCRINPAESADSPLSFMQKVQETDLQKVQSMNVIAIPATYAHRRRSALAIRLCSTADRGMFAALSMGGALCH